MTKLICLLVLCVSSLAMGQGSAIPHPMGLDTYLQYNNGGVFGGDSTFTFDDTNKILDLSGKWTSGTQVSPIDVTNAGAYGLEFHYSGNNYDVTGIRSRAQLVTTDTTATALGGLFQAANNDNINAGVLMGFMAEAIGKSTSNASTITTMRGGLIGTEWGALDTVTNLKTLHLRGHSLNAAGAGSFGTGYALYIENEAVGGNGQAYDAGIYFKGTNLSAGNKAFTYGIDFSGGTYGTADMKMSGGGYITGASSLNQNVTTTGSPTFTDLTLSVPSNIYSLSHDSFTDFAANEHYLQSAITEVGTVATGTWQATDVGISYGGTGQSTAQTAINALSAVGAAANEHVLTKDTATGNAVFKASAGGATAPGGADTQVQYNNGGAFGGDSTFTLNDTTKVVSMQSLSVDTPTLVVNAASYTDLVGIGIAVPEAKVHISNTVVGADLSAILKLEDPALTFGEHVGILFSGRSAGPGKGYFGFQQQDSYAVGDFVWYLDNAADDDSVATTDEVMRLTKEGSLGIGITPTQKLHISQALGAGEFVGASVNDATYGTSIKTGIIQAGANSYPGIWLNQNTPSVTNYAFLDGGASYSVFNSGASYIHFRIANTNKMWLYASNGLSLGSTIYNSDPGTNNMAVEGAVSSPNDGDTLGNGDTTFAITGNVMTITGDGEGNTVATITGANSGTLLTLIFVDALVTVTDTDDGGANTIDLAGTATNLTSADDTVLQLVHDGTLWRESGRSVN